MSQQKYIRPPDRTAADDARCLKCFYHGVCDSIICCEFLLTTGRRRESPAGEHCTRFLAGDPRRRWGLDQELPPGVIPGQQAKTSAVGDSAQSAENAPARKLERRVPVDRKAYKSVLQGRTYLKMAEATGYAVASLKHAMSAGVIAPELARRIYALYGVDVAFGKGGGDDGKSAAQLEVESSGAP